MADTTKRLSTSLAEFYSQRAAEKRYEREQEEQQKEYERVMTEQAAAQAATQAVAEREQNQGGFLGGLGYLGEKVALSFVSSIEGIWDYTAGGLAKLFGADDWAEQQIANDWVNYNHADEWYNPSDGWKMAGDVAGGIGASAPAMLAVAGAGAITALSGGTLAPLAATLIAGGVAGLGSAGRATKEAYDQTGELGGKEFGYGALSGFTEGAMESVSTALGAGIGAVTKNIAKSFGKEVAKSATRNTLLKGVVKGFAGEAFEEGVQAILEPYYKRMTYDPNAKNATVQEVAYAALVGGLSGAIMGGGDVAVRNIRGTTRGNTLVNEGKAGDVITTAEQISSYQTENQTDYETFQIVQNTLDELKTSLQKTGGEVSTVRQKMLLGVLEQANTSAAFEPIVTASAENIYNNAETVAARLNELGYQDQNGKPIQVTAEQIREGIDNTKGARTFRKTMSKALKTNSVLRTLAVADTVGQVSMDTARFRDATLAGQQLSTQADLNRFVEQATDAERQAVADRLGIENWETLTNEQFHDKITEFVANGGVQEYQQERSYVKEAQAVAPETARKHLPRMVNLRNDGTYRYTQGGTDIAITKRGDSYYVYDYESGLMSKALSRTETNRVLREIHTNEQNYQNGVRQHTEAQNRLREQAAEIDTYARENISEYKNLSATGQAAIRATIRQGRAAGIPEADTLMYARVAAHSGVAVIFDKELCFVGFDEKTGERKYGDGFYDPSKKRIVVNPQGKRSAERLLLHEMTHVVYNGEDGVLTVAEGVQSLTEEERETIIIAYTRVGRGSAIELSDEMNAHFAEKALSNKNILERLVQKKQTLKEKILGFFKKARTDYQSDEKLTGAAARLYRQYKKLFDEFSARNQRYLGVENASEQAVAQAENEKTRLAMRRDADGNAFVEVSPQVADSVESPKQIAETLAQIVRTKFSSFIDVHGQNIGINQRTAREWLRSKSAEKLLHTDSQAFLDKVNAFENADELLKASKEYVGEAAKHSRKDNFVEFARGIVAFKVGDNGYEADIIVGTTKSNTALLYDVVNIQHKEIVADTTDTAQDRRSGVSATTNSISQNRENVNPESQKGKKFALAGETSETADLSMLDKAKQLQAAGEDSETIRKETGWFVGYDNQWRYEIDDSAATLVEKPAFENHSTEDGGYRTAKLGDIMQHEKLYAAYPFLKDITVILQETDTGVDGSAFAEDGQIVLDQRLFTRTSKEYRKYLENRQPEIKRIEQTPEYREYNRFYTDESLQETLSAEEWLAQEEAARNKFFASELGKKYHELMWGKPNVATTEIGWSDKAKSVLMHEVQHLIQAHEGFASGSSETYWYNRLLKQYRSEAATVREKFLKLRMEAAPELQQAMYDMEDVLNRFDVSTSSIAKAYDNAAQYAKNDRQRDILWDYTQAYSKLADFYKNGRRYADDMYTNTAGEIEARDVSSRLEMTAEQRRETRPDIDRRKVYFSEKNGGGDSHSYALPDTDSDGGKLTAEQREFFGKSAIVDADGKLLKMYHGTAADFTVFDLAESGASNDHTSHIGFWFTPRKAVAENFADFNANDYQGKKARVQEVYLNIENPKIYAPTDNSVRMEELRTENTRLREQLTEEYAELKETVGRLNYMLYFTEDNIFGRRGENDIGYRVDEDYYVQYMKMSPEQAKKAKSLVDEIKKNNKQIKANETEYYRLQDDDSFLQMSDDLDEFMEWITGTNAHERGFGREHYAATNAREAAEKFRNKLIKEGYDGIWIKDTRVDDSGDQVVAFSPEQIKLVTNKRPTKNVDIRYALPELEQEAVKHFGHTYSWAETGYVLTDGSRLDFSGRHEGSGGGGRYEDHRDIAQLNAYSDLQGTDAMIDFMRRGNIRVIPEVNGINLSVRPTRAQENTLADFISRRRGEVTLDIDNERGETVVSVEYPRGTHSNKVLQDIRNYFDNGTTPTVSEVQRFRYALPETDSDGRTLTPQQREFFRDTKVVDENGRLLSVYHGTNERFTVFDKSKIGQTDSGMYGRGFYFAADKNEALAYGASAKKYYLNLKNPLKISRETGYTSILDYYLKQHGIPYRTHGDLVDLINNGFTIPSTTEITEVIRQNGYDGVIYEGYNPSEYVAFEPNQIKLTTNKKPTNNLDIRYALSEMSDEQYKFVSKLSEIQVTLTENNSYNVYCENNGGYLEYEANDLDGKRLAKYFGGELATNMMSKADVPNKTVRIVRGEIQDIVNRHKELSKLNSDLYKTAKKHFGVTTNPTEAGYINVDGSMLDFSGDHENYRLFDHRDIAEIMDSLTGEKAMNAYIQQGNIRLMPEAPSIELDYRHAPTDKQYSTIRKVVDSLLGKNGSFYVEFSNNGKAVESRRYSQGDSTNKILSDIRHYYTNGTLPEQSKLSQFRYALPDTDSTGASLSQEQREFFKDSKVVDDNGKLRVMYHGSNAEFSVFDESRMSSTTKRYMAGFYFTAEKRVAEKWSRYRARTQGGSPAVFEVYLNIKNPLYLTEQEYKRLGYDEKYRETVVNQLFENQNDGILISPEQERISGLFEDSYNYELDDSVYYQSERYGITDKEYAWWLLRAVQNPDFTSTQAAVLHADQVKLVSNKQPTSNADMRFALSDSVVNVDSANETAAWTSERVTDLIDRYGATNPRYTQAYATWINPADFVKATTVNQTRRNQIYDEAGNLDIDRLSRETQTPFLDVDYDTMRIVSHEGRHRMAALAKAGVKRVAVAIRFTESSLSRYDARIMEGEHKFKGQSFSNGDTATQRVITRTSHNSAPVGTLVPINAAYSAQLSEFTSERGVRFALDSSEDGNAQTRGNYSVGQRARFAANNTGMRVYTKAEAAEVINSIIEERLVFEDIGMYGELRGKDRQAVIDYLFRKLNTVKEDYRGGVALRIADYMIEHTVLTDMYAESNREVSEAMRKLSVLRRYMHKIDLRHIQGEIQYRFDKKNSINLVWGAKEGGIAPDTLPQLLAEEGIFIDAVNEADCFLQMVEMYEDARAAVNNATESVMLSTYGDARTIKNLRQQIARDVLNAYEQKGRKSKYAKLVEKYTKQIAELKQRLREANANNRLINSIVDQAQKMRDLKLGTFQNATQYDIEIFRSSIEKLGKIKFRGNFNIAGTRKIMADLLTWYTKENPLLADTYEQGIADMLYEVANGKTNNYTKSELQSIRNIMVYFTNYVEHFNKVYRQGKWIDAVPEATRYIDILHRNEDLKSSWFMRKVGSSYLQTFGDPLTVMRRMDRYESGFYTETFSEFREAKIDAEIAKMQLMEEYEVFLKKNKNYLSKAVNETVQYRGVEIPKMQLISLYMTLKRQHAQAGLAENGFGFWNAQDQRVRVDGFAKNITEESELRAAAVEEQSKIAELLTETDKEYIAILEKGYQEAGRLKAERDIQRLGFTNATEDYYYPIRRGNIAKNVDSAEMQQELDRISNASFNKDTVRGAKQELFIESADVVFNRHVRGVVQYAYISPAIETYNKLFNLDIAGNPNKPVSVSTESANVWKQGNDYFKKLITDIQGISPVSSEGRAVLSYIRGSYAKFQLGANPKVWVTQLSSLFASSSILDASSITRGMAVSAKDVDTYCPLAKLRAQDNTAAMAQGVLDKVGRIGNAFMAPIGKMDRFVVRRLFGACQVQVQKNGGAKIGTEANKIEAGKLLKQVILETQQNSLATERSAAMRSGNEIMRTLTMFSADSMKVIGRVIDSVGELSALKAKLRTTTDTESRAALQTQIKAARRNVCKSITALATSALFMAAIAQLFHWLYNKDRDDDETAAQQVLVDFAGNLFGGLPLVRDIYSRIMEGYSVDNYAYSVLNDLLDSTVNLFDTVVSLVSGDESKSKLTARTKNFLYALGQLTGIPTRNIYNVFYGLAKRFSSTTAYKIDELFYAKNYVTDLNKAIESDDTEMISMLMSMVFEERIGNTTMSDAVRNKFVDLYSKGYSVLPRSIGDTITYGGVEIPLTEQEHSRFTAIYAHAMKDIEKMMNNDTFNVLSEEMQAKAIKQVYDAYYYEALSDLVGVDERTTIGELSQWIDMSKLSVAFTGLSDIESDKNANGATIAGSKKKNTVKYLLKQNLSDGERLLILCYRGYSIQDGDYKGYTAKRAKRILLQYILKLNGTQTEKATLAEKCGFTVRNGRIIRDF